jgi:hypothetical protein
LEVALIALKCPVGISASGEGVEFRFNLEDLLERFKGLKWQNEHTYTDRSEIGREWPLLFGATEITQCGS